MAYPENLQLIANGQNVDYSTDTVNQYNFSYFCFTLLLEVNDLASYFLVR